MNENQNENAESLANQLRVGLLRGLIDTMCNLKPFSLEERLAIIESAAHILNSLDPARSGLASYSCGTLSSADDAAPKVA